EFLVPNASQFALGFFTARHGDDLVEDPPADLLDRFRAIEDCAGVDVHVWFHPTVERGVGRDLDTGRWFAAIDTAAAGGEHADVATAADQTGHAHRVVA